MCVVAANTTRRPATLAEAQRPARPGRQAFVEDLNWPVPAPRDRKPARPVEIWAPGPRGTWEGHVPRVQ
jgi:hypothetical protein